MGEPTPYNVGGIDIAAGSALTVQIPPRVFLGRMTGLLFDTDKTFLLPRSLAGIRGLRRFYDQHPGVQVLVVGHTDTVGPTQYNLTLSIERAHSIAAYLRDDVDGWMEYYPGRTGSAHWGTIEDQHMLKELGFHPGPITGNPSDSSDAVKRFQRSKGLNDDGQAGQRTRKALVTAYMQIDGTTLPQGTVLQTHGCGEFHLAVPTGDEVAEQKNRRVEVFFFEKRIDPPPRPRCPAPGCPEYDQWRRRTIQTFDLEHPFGALDVAVQDQQGRAVSGASVHVSGPTVGDALTDGTGHVRFGELIPGTYTVLGSRAGFRDGTAQANVSAPSVTRGPADSAIVQLQAAVQTLVITTVDPGFAPGPESLQVTYNIAALAGQTVKFRILADNYPGGKLFERDLTAAELADGTGKTLQWNGTIDNGTRNGRHATPLMAPFKAELFHSATVKSDGPFNILYHSIALDFGKHTPLGAMPDPATEQDVYVQARLNELGYDAGPVDGVVTGAATKAALRRFQRANYEAGTQALLAETGTVDPKTLAALQAAAPRALWEQGKNPLTQDAKFYVHDDFYSDRGENFITTGTPQFNSFNRKLHAEDKMERAFIPLEVEVKLVGKGGGPVSAPDAVGPVTVAWEVNDAPEDASIIPAADNGPARTYVERARKFGAAAGSVAAAARIDQDGDNAPVAFDGMRAPAAANYVKAWFPDSVGSKLSPFAVRGYGNQTRGGVVFEQAFVNAWDDANQFQQRKGRAGAYFRFSIKGGDDAKIRVSVSFDGLPNKAALETAHAGRANDLAKETGRWTVWRRSRLNAYCQQAVPTRASGTPSWGTIRDRWAQAFIEMENNGNPESTLTYSTTVTEAIFKAAILAMPATHKPASATDAAHIRYLASQMYAGPAMPAQLPGQTAQAYVAACQAAMSAWVTHPINAILGVIHGNVRRTKAEGFIIFDFRIHDPISGQDWNPAANAGAGGFVPTANPAARNQTSSLSGYVRLDGAVTMCVDNPFNVNCYVMHECGHARFLYHFKTGGGGAADPVQTAHHHDLDQERCIMSYGINPDGPNAWDYRFCGKCILRLRGWNVLALTDRYTP